MSRQVFREGQGPNPHLVASATELGEYVAREEARVAASDVHIEVRTVHEAIYHIREPVNVLDLIQEHIEGAVALSRSPDALVEAASVAQRGVLHVIELHADHMVIRNALVAQPVAIKAMEQVRLVSSPDAREHLGHAVLPPLDETIEA